MKVFPVIHFKDVATTLDQVALCQECGSDGVFLISHHRDDDGVLLAADRAKKECPDLLVGINLLSTPTKVACELARDRGYDMVWADNMGVSSIGLNSLGDYLSIFALENPSIKLFASVAFKYQDTDPDPSSAAKNAISSGFFPVTSGPATGVAPLINKIASMSVSTGGELGIASGMTIENVSSFSPYLSAILVSTGISLDEYHIDREKLIKFIEKAKA